MITNTANSMNVMSKALDAYTLRNSTISNNIANADTPGYKRKDVNFENVLNETINELATKTPGIANKNNKSRIANQNQLKSNDNPLNLVKPEVYEQETDSMYRIDGNNIDIDNEMAELVKNQLRYSTVLNQINKQFQTMRTAMGK